ncbi:MAG: SAM-dependent methyltransferase [Bacteroidales bacterium]|nr:SAM-dependent methyltransferase [Bacteroidales bacterium]
MKGRLFLIPTPLGEGDPKSVLTDPIFEIIQKLEVFVVEETRSARRFLSSAGLKGRIDTLTFYELNEHSSQADAEKYVAILDEGIDVGLLSEAGLPAVADPGASLVALAHKHGVEVIPFVGPSSLLLALMSSGLNGQSFAFNGYLPVKSDLRRSEIKRLERLSAQTGQTQICIETPYRNDSLFSDFLAVCAPGTQLCIAADITLPTQTIITKSISEWNKSKFEIGKRPCVFVFSAK